MSDAWSYSVGESPYTVTVYENERRGLRLYLKWRDRLVRNWAYRALGRGMRTATGRQIKHVAEWAKGEAKKQHEALLRGVPAEIRPTRQLAIGDTVPLIIDQDKGLYPTDTAHRREVLREIAFASRVWGPERLWNSVGRAEMRELRRRRTRALHDGGAAGLRGTEITISRILVVAGWLRDEGHIDDRAALPEREWRKALRGEVEAPTPNRPRYTGEEMRALIRNAGKIDPRLGLAVALGAELRLGQVIRGRRSQLNLEVKTYEVKGRGKKRGAVVELTEGQMAAVQHALTEGYLRILEVTAPDYPLFPAGQMKGGRKGDGVAKAEQAHAQPIDRNTLQQWWRELEELLAIPHVPGRGAYGVRRVAVDEALREGIDRDALKEHGGWADTQMPDRIYREQGRAEAREKARDVRAKIRGET